MKAIWWLELFVVLGFAFGLAAHRPVLLESHNVQIADPMISSAFFNELLGEPGRYYFTLEKEQQFFVEILLPLPHVNKPVSAKIFREGGQNPIAILDGNTFSWTLFFEPYGYDYYWKGPYFRKVLPQGNYVVEVFNKNNTGKYVLAVGELESFPLNVIFSTIRDMPKIKRQHFEKNPIDFILSPFGATFLGLIYFMSFIGVVGYRYIARRVSSRMRRRTLYFSLLERVANVFLGVAILVITLVTNWHPFALLASGIMVFAGLLASSLKSPSK